MIQTKWRKMYVIFKCLDIRFRFWIWWIQIWSGLFKVGNIFVFFLRVIVYHRLVQKDIHHPQVLLMKMGVVYGYSTTNLFNTMFYFVNDFLNILKVPILYIELRPTKTQAFKTFRQNMIVIPPNFEQFNRLFLLNEPPVINIKINFWNPECPF